MIEINAAAGDVVIFSESTTHAVSLAAAGETAILLQPPLPSVGTSIWMERGCQQHDSLADGQVSPWRGEQPRRTLLYAFVPGFMAIADTGKTSIARQPFLL